MENKSSRLESFLQNPSKALWTMALPIVAGMLVQTLFNVIDIMFIGWVGADEITAVAFVSPLFFIIIGLTVGLGAGVTATIAQYIGKKDKESADKVANQTILIGLIITLFLTILGEFFAKDLMILLGAQGEILDIALSYLKILIYGIGLVVFSLFFRAILAGEGETKIPMYIGLFGTVMNLILDPIFIFTLDLKVPGAAIATVLSQLFMVVAYLYFIFIKKSTYISFRLPSFQFNQSILSKIFQIGIPSSLSMLIISFGQVVMNRILINYSNEAVAAYQVVSRLDMLIFIPILGIAISLTTIVGMFYGAQEFEKLKGIVSYGLRYATILTVLLVIGLYISASKILPLFSENQEVIAIGVTYLKIIVLVYPFVGYSVICSRICQALGKGIPLLVTTITRVLLITAPLSYYFYIIQKPIEYVWFAQVVAIIFAALISYIWMRYYFKKFAIV